jgi:methylated-DNA-[protein]-cysteine S-methyltransferase
MMTTRWTHVYGSPIGELRLELEGDALVRLRLPNEPAGEGGQPDPERFAQVVRQLDAYFAGELERFELPMRLAGTAFQREVWAALDGVGYGERVSYGELARRLGKAAGASRAVGAAVGKNPLPIIVPCHRIVGADGAMTGYLGGLEAKVFLLELEGPRRLL